MKKIKILIFWGGFPACAMLMKEVVADFEDVIIVGSRAKVPFKGLEEIFDYPIVWLDKPDDIWDRKDEFSDRNFIIHTGWNHKGWLKFDSWIKKRNGAKIVLASDNNFKNNIRQKIGSIYFRLFLQKYFDAVFVPGQEGVRLMEFFGVPNSKIYVGLYGAYEEIYYFKKDIKDRDNEFLFVGQLIGRKSVDKMLVAFKKYRELGGKWNLRILGDGELRDLCKGEGIIFEGFTQPHLVAGKMNNAKVLVLLSQEEHWGTVVCEAAACGMQLLCYKNVGSAVDIIRKNINGIVLDSLDINSIVKSFFYFETLNEELFLYGSNVSKSIAKGYESKAYHSAVKKMIVDLFYENTPN